MVGRDSTISLLPLGSVLSFDTGDSRYTLSFLATGLLKENFPFVFPLPQGQQGQHFKYHVFQTLTASGDRTP